MKKTASAIRFSIGAKLVTIITILVLVSLGSITVLVSWLVSQDLQVTAEESNFEENRRLASEMEHYFAYLISNSLIVMKAMDTAGANSASAKEMADFFFDRSRDIAAVVFSVPGTPNQFLVNEHFFLGHDLDSSLAAAYGGSDRENVERAAAGETLLVNVTPHFAFPLLALYFPLPGAGGGTVIFSAENMIEIFGFGTNQSFLINGDGDILIHSDYDLVRTGANMANREYIRTIRESTMHNMQILYTDEGIRYFGAFTKLNVGDSILITCIEYDKVFEGVAATTWRNVYLTITVLSLSILFIWFFSKSISVPLKSLANAANAIESGNFKVELQAKSRDEIGFLTNSFQRMSSALGIFGKFTNRDLAVQAMRGELKPGGLPKQATIFFSDVRDFTGRSEIFTREFGSEASDRIVLWLNEYLTKMVECIEKTGGIVDKFIGDGVMAHWGTAHSSGDVKEDALNSVRAALMMRSELIKVNSKRRPDDVENPPINIGCSINSGVVTAGQIGSDLRMEYTVIGDPVNIASRIENLNKPFNTDILIAEDTWNLVKDRVIAEEMPPTFVKGKEKPVRLFAVIDLADCPDGPRTIADVRKLLGLKAPDILVMDTYEEAKYKIGRTEE